MAANRCLSDLPDDLLRHILSFAPAKEAAATAVISRRWRSLWRTCGAVNLDSRSYGRRLNNGETCDGFFRGAEAALAAARAPIRKLTLYVELEEHEDFPEPETLPSRSGAAKQGLHGMIGALLSKPAARRVEELRIGAQLFVGASMGALPGCGFHELRFGAHHPSEALRVLHVTNCIRFTPAPPGTPFPRLAEIRLRNCWVSQDKDKPYAGPHPTCGGERDDDEEEDEEYPALLLTDDDAAPRAIPVPRRLFSFLMLRSLRLGLCQLDLPAAIDLPSLDTLLLTRVVGPGAGAQIQRLVTACPRLADLTLEACAKLTTLSVLDKRLRRLAVLCCHKLAAVSADASELRVFEYRGVVPAPSFLTTHGTPRISSCALDFCGEEPTDPSELRGFLQLFACAKHLQLNSAQLGAGVGNGVFPSSPAFPTFASLQRLELMGLCPRDDATGVAALTRVLGQTPILETLSLFFLPEPLTEADNNHANPYDGEASLGTHRLRYDRHAALAAPDGAEIPCMKQRVREINLVHYQGGVSQRTLAKFLLRNAPAIEELCCTFAPGPLWMQTKLMEEMRGWVMNISTKLTFL
ncbi:hypothetical protein GQ55_5G122300 [Panicum hallii var. hallii]|uniref:F-box domain-containing protein n=1 Tax=Panicum hallii var. hallii TaxID=1504633 RepID=A0A2T7DFG3_9POAL|nr:hypothetical protein GQ55_5G122300 [Panicum hallii var. hallii]